MTSPDNPEAVRRLLENLQSDLKNISLESFGSKNVSRQVNFRRTKIGDKYQNSKTQMRHF